MWIGRFSFTQEEDPRKVWIQIIGDGEGGAFFWKDIPNVVKKVLNQKHSQEELERALDAMAEFWKNHF